MAAARVFLMGGIVLLTLAFTNSSAADTSLHHHVGEDRGWDANSNVASWAAGRVFTVGDSIWFTFSAAQEKIVELGSREEYEACDLSNPIRMYADGISKVLLEKEGSRYFASGNSDSCKRGLKLPIDVKSETETGTATNPLFLDRSEESAVASSPSSPSGAGRVCGGVCGGIAIAIGALLAGVILLWV